MFATKFVAGSLGIVLGVAAAVAIARPPSEIENNRLLEIQSPAASCPNIEWPYGCDWRPTNSSPSGHASIRKGKARHLSLRRLYDLF
jgi:hypothetical protein